MELSLYVGVRPRWQDDRFVFCFVLLLFLKSLQIYPYYLWLHFPKPNPPFRPTSVQNRQKQSKGILLASVSAQFLAIPTCPNLPVLGRSPFQLTGTIYSSLCLGYVHNLPAASHEGQSGFSFRADQPAQCHSKRLVVSRGYAAGWVEASEGSSTDKHAGHPGPLVMISSGAEGLECGLSIFLPFSLSSCIFCCLFRLHRVQDVVQTDLELITFLLRHPEGWDYRPMTSERAPGPLDNQDQLQ